MSRYLPGLGSLRAACSAPLRARTLIGRNAPLSTTTKVAASSILTSGSSLLTRETVSSMWARQPHPSTPTTRLSMTQKMFQRAFSSSPLLRIRDHYNRSSMPPPFKNGPIQKLRNRVNRWNPLYVVYAIMAINIAIFLLWQYAISSYQRFRDPALYQWMYQNFILSVPNIMQGRLWTLITSSFSQQGTGHIFFNMLGLYFMAPGVAALLGSFNFLCLYLGGGLFAGLCSLGYQALNRSRSKIAGSEGASGAIYTCLAFYGTIFPQATFLIFFVVPAKAWMVVGGLFAWDLFETLSRKQSLKDSAGHLGGLIFGVGAAFYARHKYLGSWRRGFRL